MKFRLPIRMSLATAVVLALTGPAPAQTPAHIDRLPEDEIIYLVMPDRFENGDRTNDRAHALGDRSVTGFDPTDKAFYHGGDIRGVIDRLDYIQDLGATALWLTPVFTNKWVQGEGGSKSAGYHGYWITNFLDVDPHLGSRADYKALVDAAHSRGMKVYLDIVVNHTADVIRYEDCSADKCAYRPLGEEPYKAFVPALETSIKQPAWLNDPSLYHNRGESTFEGESSRLGDFVGLDDVKTEDARVVQGFIDLYAQWIDDFGVDGFRVDTAKHVNPEFWQAFIPAMLERARARSIRNFHIFGEVMEFEPEVLAHYTRVDKFPAVNDFALQSAIVDVIARRAAPDRLARVFEGDARYSGGEATARRLVTLVSNHDVKRIGRTIRSGNPEAGEDEIMKRAVLANAILLHARGVPALYYGDEQGFVGDGDIDQDSREDMFATQVSSYRDDRLIGGSQRTGQSHFDDRHPLFRAIAEMARRRTQDPALRRGRQITRVAARAPGLFAFSRLLAGSGETLVVINTSTSGQTAVVPVEGSSRTWQSMHGSCAQSAGAEGYAVRVPPLDYVVCKAREPAGG